MDAGEAAWNLTRALGDPAAAEKFVGRRQLRPGLHRPLRHPGQLQRLPGLGHHQPEQAHPEDRRTSARRRRATSRSTRTCSSSRARALSGRVDCGTEGVKDTVSTERLRGIRIFDISDIANPKYIANVQTCRGSHTHSVLVPPGDPGQRLRLRLRLGRDPLAQRAAGLRQGHSHRGQRLGPVPDRSHQGAAGPSRAGGDRQLAPDLQRPGGAAASRRDPAGQHRPGQGRCGRQGSRRLHGGNPRPGAGAPLRLHQADAGQHGQGTRGQRRPDRGRQRRPSRGAAGHHRQAGGSGAEAGRRPQARPDPVPRHHALPRHRPGRRRLRRLRPADRHQRPREPQADRRRRRLELLLLALGHLQQRRHQGPLLRRVGRRRPAQVPRHRPDASGGRTRSSRSTTGRCSSRATTSCRRCRRRTRTAWRTTAR